MQAPRERSGFPENCLTAFLQVLVVYDAKGKGEILEGVCIFPLQLVELLHGNSRYSDRATSLSVQY